MKKMTMLHYAAKRNLLWIGELLISKEVDVNSKSYKYKSGHIDKGGKTPHHFAAENNSKEIGELLISKGANRLQ